jgi:hypothetical protein
MLSEVPEQHKPRAALGRVIGSCQRGDFDHARASISFSFTEENELKLKSGIVYFGALAREKKENLPSWKVFDAYLNNPVVNFIAPML